MSEEASTVSTEDEDAVAFVYVPTRPYEPALTSEAEEIHFELRSLDDGSAGLAVFTGEEQLVAQLGTHQPYVKIAVLDLLVQISAAKVPVVVNPVLRPGVEQWTEAGVKAWQAGAT